LPLLSLPICQLTLVVLLHGRVYIILQKENDPTN
jgi:hypothetical protein